MKKLKMVSTLLFLALSSCVTGQMQSVVSENTDGLTPLQEASGRGDVPKMTSLLEKGVDINALDPRMGVTALHKAVYSGNPRALSLILSHNPLLNVQATNGNTPLHDAIYFKKKEHGREIIELLLKAGAALPIKNRAGFTPLEAAVLLKDSDAVTMLKKEALKRFTPEASEFMEAVKKNDISKVQRILLSLTAPIEETDDEGLTPLLWASREGFFNIAGLLLDHGANPNHLDAWMGTNAGHQAAFWGRTQVMKLLVVHNLDINARGLYNGYTPLHNAVSENHTETARVLILAGARTDIQGHDGKTAVDIARENKNEEMLKILGAK